MGGATPCPKGLKSDLHERAQMDQQHRSTFLGKTFTEKHQPPLTTCSFMIVLYSKDELQKLETYGII